MTHEYETMKYSGEEAIREWTKLLDALNTKLEEGQEEKINNEDKLDRFERKDIAILSVRLSTLFVCFHLTSRVCLSRLVCLYDCGKKYLKNWK